ncbi:MAG: hypothetical protein E7352_05595 [Clostridiales bacterium]|nr:hypothetical protein [Clostridiales bacterium]MBE5747624.1 hypothetical protein [Clostridiales bacterium]
MDKDLIRILFALLRFEVNSAELCESDKNLITEDVLKGLYNLSKRHDLAHLVGDALDKNGLLLDGSEAQKRFLKERNMAVYRYEQLQYELDRVCEVFEKEKIPFIPLKGAVVRQYYPEPWMRTSCDIDILVKRKDVTNAIQILKRKLGFTSDEVESSHDISLFSVSGMHLELHFDLTEGDKYGKEILSKIWSYAKPKKDLGFHNVIPDEVLYVYHITHMIKHFEYGGCGIKPFVDLWVLYRVLDLRKETDVFLKIAKVERFERVVRQLSLVWGQNAEHNELTKQMAEYIFRGGVYGTMGNRVLTQQTKRGGKGKYLFSRLFPSYKSLAIKYPSLKKYPILYPFYLVRRWGKILFVKETNKNATREIAMVSKIDKKQRHAQKEFIKKLGL